MNQDRKPRIDFYKLRNQSRSGIELFCCQLADKVVKMDKPVFVLTHDAVQSRQLDDFMWTFNDSSFVPHDIQDNDDNADTPVIIGHDIPERSRYLLINLTDMMPARLYGFERVAEIINDEPAVLHRGRQRYSNYRNDAYPLHYHEINP
ncbi:MAG: DNA polymerase III subunit chi [Gammaproteobacteria bacterium]|nr:DNA polymerase III subunit chi [Gammaproteobacteria bacterium]